MSRTLRRRLVPIALVAGLSAAATTGTASAQEATPPPSPPPADAAVAPPPPPPPPEVVERQQALDTRAKVLRAEAGSVRREALRLRDAVAAQELRVSEARAAADAAAEVLVAARQARVDAGIAVTEQRKRTKELAANAYIRGPASVDMILRSDTINDAVRRHAMAASAGEVTARTLAALDRAEKAAQRAEAETQAQSLAQEQARQTLLLTAVNDRLEHTLAESAALAEIDLTAAGSVAERDALLRDVMIPLPPITGLRPSLPAVPTVLVGGIRVSAALGPQLQGLLDAAAQAGFVLGGGGYRDPSSQVALRVLHCGPTDFDIYDKPPGECIPPTARPGTSNHERGLAVDFTVNGRALTSELDPAFQWLAVNAATYGLYNLPGEPWHWSTTGS